MNDDDKSESELAMGCWAVFGALAAIPLLMMMRGYVLVRLWQWFFEPVVHWQPTVVQAIGMALLLGLFTTETPQWKDDEKRKKPEPIFAIKGVFSAVLKNGLVLLLGYILFLLSK